MDLKDSETGKPALISVKGKVPSISYINSDKYVIGRGYDAHLKILEKAISRKHCSLERISSFGWTITSHSRNAVEVNDVVLVADESKSLKCGDKIILAGVCSFIFKCSPNVNQMCCCDIPEEDTPTDSITIPSKENSCASIPSSLPSASSFEVLDITSPTQPQLPTTSKAVPFALKKESNVMAHNSKESKSLPKFDNLREEIQKYIKKLEESNIPDTETMDMLKENLSHLKQLNDMNENCAYSQIDLLPTVQKVIRFCKSKPSHNMPSEDSRLNNLTSKMEMFLAENMKHLLHNILDSLERYSINTSIRKCKSDDEREDKNEKSTVQQDSEIEVVEHNSEDNTLKNELKNYKQNSEWLEARIQFLEIKLKERDKFEKELKTSKEENEALELQLHEMRSKLSKMEVMELELSYLKETTKYKEDDKRIKDELENQITTLRKNLADAREEIEKVAISKSMLENENSNLKQKCEELYRRATAKVGCSRDESTGDSCCDFVGTLKDNIIKLLEKEFNCCICGEMYIEATVTNCNHVFCAFCFKEWKKKKKQCPICRTNVIHEYRANVIDEFILGVVKLISDKLFAERMQIIEDRKNIVTPPPTKRVCRRRGGVRNLVYAVPVPLPPPPPPTNAPYANQNFVIDLG